MIFLYDDDKATIIGDGTMGGDLISHGWFRHQKSANTASFCKANELLCLGNDCEKYHLLLGYRRRSSDLDKWLGRDLKKKKKKDEEE